MSKFEYRTIIHSNFIKASDIEYELNQLGQKGWHIVGCTHTYIFLEREVQVQPVEHRKVELPAPPARGGRR